MELHWLVVEWRTDSTDHLRLHSRRGGRSFRSSLQIREEAVLPTSLSSHAPCTDKQNGLVIMSGQNTDCPAPPSTVPQPSPGVNYRKRDAQLEKRANYDTGMCTTASEPGG